jgi:diaminopropionate ammonia-lyase
MDNFAYILRRRGEKPPVSLTLTSLEQAEQVGRFHSGLPGYAPTPLVSLPGQAQKLGIGKLWVKDESKRFGLNAFKALGGSCAMGKYLADRLGCKLDETSFEALCSPQARQQLGEITFVTATDGNHGRGVAWSARLLGHKAVVYMPKGSAPERLENIRAQGAQAEITPYNYDDAVRLASRMAREKGWVLVQDTAWPGYEETPAHIMQGYMTLARETARQLEEMGEEKPTHLFLQAGVGSFAGAVLGYFTSLWGEDRPVTVIVEPEKADCIYQPAKADDGQLHFVTGEMDSMMAGLCCGEPCTISWEILNAYADGFLSCGDGYAARGMRLLGRPENGDPAVVSGESGAVGAGVLQGIMTEDRLEALRRGLGLDGQSRVLLISTEGDTDRENYQRILAEEI